jgi:hypothetical protein
MDNVPLPREDALEAAGQTLGLALADYNSALIDRLVCIGIGYAVAGDAGDAGGDADEELARLDDLPDEVSYATQAGYAVAALLSHYGGSFGLTDQDVTVFARAAAAGALIRLHDDDDTRCSDCGTVTLSPEPGVRAEWYTVHDEVWAAAGAEPHGVILCIGCLEARLGRWLGPDDFSGAPLNDLSVADSARYAWSWRTDRLVSRLTPV